MLRGWLFDLIAGATGQDDYQTSAPDRVAAAVRLHGHDFELRYFGGNRIDCVQHLEQSSEVILNQFGS